MFDIDTFIADCRDAVEKDRTHKSVAEVVRRAREVIELDNPAEGERFDILGEELESIGDEARTSRRASGQSRRRYQCQCCRPTTRWKTPRGCRRMGQRR